MKRLLLIEDEDVIRRALVRMLQRRGFEVHAVGSVEDALAGTGPDLHVYDVVLADLRLPGGLGTDVIEPVAPCPVVIMTSHASVRSAVDAMQAGASDYIAKPFDHEELLLVLERAMQRDRLAVRSVALMRDLDRLLPPSLRIESTSLEQLAESLAAPIDGPARLWLHGAAGAGREAVARAVHARGPHADGPLVVADVGAMDETTRAALARSDTRRDLPGLRAARYGTLVLRRPERLDAATQDAIAEQLAARPRDAALTMISEAVPEHLQPALQAALCAVIPDERRHAVPTLATRRADIPIHAEHVLDAITLRTGRPRLTLGAEASRWLSARDWPGEVLELEQLVARAALGAAGPTLARSDFTGLDTAFDTAPDLEGYFRWFVTQHQGALSETALAARLGISRKALWERRQRSGLPRPT